MARPPRKQLSASDWIKAAFRRLAAGDAGALKAEVLARHCKVTKGSFYWHFKDVTAFRREMLKLWESEATGGIKEAILAQAAPGRQRLALLLRTISELNAANEYGGLRAEPAIRDWARKDRVAAAALRRVDETRIAFVAALFGECGFPPAEARTRAELLYSGYVGQQALAAARSLEILPRLDLLLELLLRP
ncbi:MAG: TetR/AcrR family transcriptional regulator [Hyphomicrobiales bacterium]|nr:TetR/AcrR family transcriptional regulator [Hyphomicrobiales bacterium]